MLKQKKYVVDEEEEEKENKSKKKKKKVIDVIKPAVIAKNVEDLADLVMKERGLNPEASVIQIGIDDGQGLLKVMMTVKEKERHEIV